MPHMQIPSWASNVDAQSSIQEEKQKTNGEQIQIERVEPKTSHKPRSPRQDDQVPKR